MLMRFSRVHAILVLLYEREEIEKAYWVKTIETRRLRAMQNGVHPERWKGKADGEPEAEHGANRDDAQSDSVDSLICSWDSSMLMRFSRAHEVLHAHHVLLCEREGIARVY